MHRYRIVAQISLILSILNLVFATPVVVQEIHEARGDEMVVAEDATAMPNKRRELDAAPSSRPTSPRSSQDEMTSSQNAVASSQDAMASPQHSSLSDGSTTSSGYSAPYLSSDESVQDNWWMLDRPPRLSLSGHLPAPLPAPPEPASPHPSTSSSGSSDSSDIAWEIVFPEPLPAQELAPEMPPPAQGLAPEIVEIPPSPQHTGSDRATTETHSLSDPFTPSPHYSLGSDGSVSSHDSISMPSLESISGVHSHDSISMLSLDSISGGVHSHNSISMPSLESISMPSLESISGGSVPSHHSMPQGLMQSLTPDGSPLLPSPPPTEAPPDNAEFFNKNMMKKLKIAAGVIIVGGTIAAIVGSQIKHNKHRDSQDS